MKTFKDPNATAPLWKKALLVVAFLVAYFVAGALARTGARDTEPSHEARVSSAKNGFLSACEKDASETVCKCAYDNLKTLRGEDWFMSQEAANRVQASGYNKQETDVVIPCIK